MLQRLDFAWYDNLCDVCVENIERYRSACLITNKEYCLIEFGDQERDRAQIYVIWTERDDNISIKDNIE